MFSQKYSRLLLAALIASHCAIFLAGFFAPYSFETQNRELAFAPPMRIHFLDDQRKLHTRPFVYRWVPRLGSLHEYQEDRTAIYPIRFFVLGAPYEVFGIGPLHVHLFGVDEPARLILAGSDAYGRDEFSRLLFGGRISLFAGLLAATISLGLGTALGGLAGYYGRWIDDTIMRVSEIFLSVPWLYLLLAIRAILPLHIEARGVFLLLVAVLGIAGWARPGRLIRGVVLSAKERDYVMAARGFGASDFYLLRKHILPSAASVIVTQMALYIPQYILAEVMLSFFGLGVSEPVPSWGNMLAELQKSYVLQSCWWMLAPAAALVCVFLAYHRLFRDMRQTLGASDFFG